MQASWNGARVAAKFIVSDTEEKLQSSVAEAITARMLTHPHVVNCYATAVMSAQEVLAAIEASRPHCSSNNNAAPQESCSSDLQDSTRASVADEVARLLALKRSSSTNNGDGAKSTSTVAEADPGGSGTRLPVAAATPSRPTHQWEGGRSARANDDFSFGNPVVDGQAVVSLETVAESLRLKPDQYVTTVVVSEELPCTCLCPCPCPLASAIAPTHAPPL